MTTQGERGAIGPGYQAHENSADREWTSADASQGLREVDMTIEHGTPENSIATSPEQSDRRHSPDVKVTEA